MTKSIAPFLPRALKMAAVPLWQQQLLIESCQHTAQIWSESFTTARRQRIRYIEQQASELPTSPSPVYPTYSISAHTNTLAELTQANMQLALKASQQTFTLWQNTQWRLFTLWAQAIALPSPLEPPVAVAAPVPSTQQPQREVAVKKPVPDHKPADLTEPAPAPLKRPEPTPQLILFPTLPGHKPLFKPSPAVRKIIDKKVS